MSHLFYLFAFTYLKLQSDIILKVCGRLQPLPVKHKQASNFPSRMPCYAKKSKWTTVQATFMPKAIRFREIRKTTDDALESQRMVDEESVIQSGEEDKDGAEVFGQHTEEYADLGREVERYDLLLPSAAFAVQHNLAPPSLVGKEIKLRQAQLDMLVGTSTPTAN